jgi:hypothetical protein
MPTPSPGGGYEAREDGSFRLRRGDRDDVRKHSLKPRNLPFRTFGENPLHIDAKVEKAGPKWERRSLVAEPRSVYLLRGPSRSEWEHSIPGVDSFRYSITFRNVLEGTA